MSLVADVVVYDIADDDRREDVAMFLSQYGPRVQPSVFEVDLPDAEAAAFRSQLSAMIEPEDDQIRLYAIGAQTLAQRIVYGQRTLESVTTSGSSRCRVHGGW
jgi:CRISPR-associated protein Cas2